MKPLLQRAQQGDPQATAELFTRYWRAARAAAYGVTGDWAAAEDAAAEGFTQALGSLASLHDPDRFPAWLRTIVIRKARAARPRPSAKPSRCTISKATPPPKPPNSSAFFPAPSAAASTTAAASSAPSSNKGTQP